MALRGGGPGHRITLHSITNTHTPHIRSVRLHRTHSRTAGGCALCVCLEYITHARPYECSTARSSRHVCACMWFPFCAKIRLSAHACETSLWRKRVFGSNVAVFPVPHLCTISSSDIVGDTATSTRKCFFFPLCMRRPTHTISHRTRECQAFSRIPS